MNRQINKSGLGIIKSCEGLRLQSYKCPAGILTVGYGHTGKDVRMGMKITPEIAEQFLERDLERFCLGVSELVKVQLTDNQFSALVSFAFNVGLGNLGTSTLLKLLNQERYAEAAEQFPRWNKAGGRVLNGLVSRRQLERQLFLT
jgi:lysozyme